MAAISEGWSVTASTARKQEQGLAIKPQGPCDPLLPSRLHIPKVQQPSHTATQSGDKVFKLMNLGETPGLPGFLFGGASASLSYTLVLCGRSSFGLCWFSTDNPYYPSSSQVTY